MSKMADLEIEIMDMLEDGESPLYISRVLNIPASWVYDVISAGEVADELSPFSTVNS